MTTTKTTTTTTKTGATETPGEKTSPELMHTAYQIHTLAQIVRGEIAATHPWVTPVIPPAGFEPTAAWMPPIGAAPMPSWGMTTPWTW